MRGENGDGSAAVQIRYHKGTIKVGSIQGGAAERTNEAKQTQKGPHKLGHL